MKRASSPLAPVLIALQTALEWTVIVVMAALVLVVLWGVASRYLSQFAFLNFLISGPSPWTDEAAQYLLMWVALLGAAVAYRRGEHLGFDYVASRLDAPAKRWLAVAAEITVLAFAAFAMVYGGFVLVSKTLGAGQQTPALGVPMGYVYLAAPISGTLIVIFAVDRLWQLIAGGPADDADPSTTAPDVPPAT